MKDGKSHCLSNLAIKLCVFLKWILWGGDWTSSRAILVWNHICDFKSNSRCPLVRFWTQTKLHSTQFNYHHFCYAMFARCIPLYWRRILLIVAVAVHSSFVCYYPCCVFRSTEESSPRVKPKFKTETKFKDPERKNRLTEEDAERESRRKFSGPKMKFPKSKDKVNVWSKQKKENVKKKEQAPCWVVVFVFCCGVSKEHQWYSLLGKGEMQTISFNLFLHSELF